MKIIIADGRGALWQWDTGRRVKITDGDGVKQVHYQNRFFCRSVDVDVEDDGTAIIPDELLQDYHTLTAYAYVTDDAGGYTKVQQDFAVYKRPKPSDYIYTPTEHEGFDRLRAEIGELSALQTNAKENLVAAINEAAASESMGLRVADGYIQYSTDDGSTWTNLIAVSDLKGAGMDITGAKVGQIAKIAAVDASGVPTEWSPADMPSGGSPDAVLYTRQTLTDAQKKQARENIDAASYFVVNGTLGSDGTVTLDKTLTQIREAALGGISVLMRVDVGESYGYFPLVTTGADYCIFAVSVGQKGRVALQEIGVGPDNVGAVHISRALVFNSDGTLPQATMYTNPTSPMQIATKKYVDDSVAGAGGGSVPKPLTYDYMPEGYPKKSMQTTTLLEEQEIAFALMEDPIYGATLQSPIEIVVSQTYTIKWDGNEYECVCVVSEEGTAVGNLSIMGSGDDTGEPFLYLYNKDLAFGIFGTLETSTSHNICVNMQTTVYEKIDENYLPESAFTDADWDSVSNRPIFTKPLNANITAENITETIIAGDNFVALGVTAPDFNRGLYYKAEGEISFLNNSGNKKYTLRINGFYKADSSAMISLGTVYDEYGKHNLDVAFYGNNNSFYGGKLGVSSSGNSYSYTITANFTIISEVKQLSEDCIPNTIQRVGDDVIISSSTPDSTKKFKITVDDNGTISATEVT